MVSDSTRKGGTEGGTEGRKGATLDLLMETACVSRQGRPGSATHRPATHRRPHAKAPGDGGHCPRKLWPKGHVATLF